MKPVKVVDARMGRGKTSAAIRYMNERRGEQRFMFITPYLTEVERVRDACGFIEPKSENQTKTADLRRLLHEGRSVSMTHALFYLMDRSMMNVLRERGYALIVDESLDLISRLNISAKDTKLITQQLTTEDENGWLAWNDSDYEGRFDDFKRLADTKALFRLDSALMNIVSPDVFDAFSEVIMLTYMFDGQYQRGYFDYCGIEYEVVGVETDELGFKFSDKPDSPPPLDFSSLITILDNKRMNRVGDSRTALSKNWYAGRSNDDEEVKAVRRNLENFFRHHSGDTGGTRIWTTFKTEVRKVVSTGGRFRSSYLPMNIRATNEYREATAVAYLVNRFCDPNITKFFAEKNIHIDNEAFALSEMLQFIWRSAIRDNKPITLYIPSKRMRDLLVNWINETKQGGH